MADQIEAGVDGGGAPDSYRVTADKLRQFIERLEADKKDIADQQKEMMAEAKARGCRSPQHTVV